MSTVDYDGRPRAVAGVLHYGSSVEPGTIVGRMWTDEHLVALGTDEHGGTIVGFAQLDEIQAADRLLIEEHMPPRSTTEAAWRRAASMAVVKPLFDAKVAQHRSDPPPDPAIVEESVEAAVEHMKTSYKLTAHTTYVFGSELPKWLKPDDARRLTANLAGKGIRLVGAASLR